MNLMVLQPCIFFWSAIYTYILIKKKSLGNKSNCLKELRGGKTGFGQTITGTRTHLNQPQTPPPHLMGSINARREKEGDPSSSQSYLQQLHVSLLFLLPNENLNQTSRECPLNVWEIDSWDLKWKLNSYLEEGRKGCDGWEITDKIKRTERGRRRGRTRRMREGILPNWPDPLRFKR
jgi:hypothetical protein